MKKLIAASILLVGLSFNANAQAEVQQVINASGGTSLDQDYSFDWSIGELALVNNMESPDNRFRLTNGFLQPYSILTYHKEKSYFEKLDIRVYPNPTKGPVAIDFFTMQKGMIALTVVNDGGKVIYQESIAYNGLGQLYELNLQNYPAGVYTLYIYLDPEKGAVRKSGAFRVMKLNY